MASPARAIRPAMMEMTPKATIQPHRGRNARIPSPRLCGPVLSVAVIVSALSLRNGVSAVYAGRVALSQHVCDNRCMTEPPQKAPPAPRPATTVLLVRPSRPGDAASALEVFMVVRHQQIDAFSGAIVFPGGKLEDADGDQRLRARCGGADKISVDELKFRVAG